MRRRTIPDIGDLITLRDDRFWVGYITEKQGLQVRFQCFDGTAFWTRRDNVYVLSLGGK